MKIRKGDNVMVRTGKDKGKTGTVLSVIPELNKVLIDGINIVKRAYKPSQKHPKGGIISQPSPVHISNIGLLHPDKKDSVSRVGFEIKDGKKVRVYRQANNKEVK